MFALVTSKLMTQCGVMLASKRFRTFIDATVTWSASIFVLGYAQSLLVLAVLLSFGFYQWVRGRADAKLETKPVEAHAIPPKMIQDIMRLPPGRAIRYAVTIRKNGVKEREVDMMMIEASDFEHLLSLAGFRVSVVEKSHGKRRSDGDSHSKGADRPSG